VFGFVGRFTDQKGVLLIFQSAWDIIERLKGKVQFIIGGLRTKGDTYGEACASEVWKLRQKYPECVWADPEAFFLDGPTVNLGSDFGLMPSLFEPGGIVQMEVFLTCFVI
jgi:starch synthase